MSGLWSVPSACVRFIGGSPPTGNVPGGMLRGGSASGCTAGPPNMSVLHGKAVAQRGFPSRATHRTTPNTSRERILHLCCSCFAQQRLGPRAISGSTADYHTEAVVGEPHIVPGLRLEPRKSPVHQEAEHARQRA